jgi:hypothetical protein
MAYLQRILKSWNATYVGISQRDHGLILTPDQLRHHLHTKLKEAQCISTTNIAVPRQLHL